MKKLTILIIITLITINKATPSIDLTTGSTGTSGGMHTAGIKIGRYVYVLKGQDLNFGEIIPSGTDGYVRLYPSSATSTTIKLETSNVSLKNVPANTSGMRGKISFTSSSSNDLANRYVHVIAEPPAYLATDAEGTGPNTMALTDTGIICYYNRTSSSQISPNEVIFSTIMRDSGSSSQLILSYGKLLVAGNQRPGEYTASYPITFILDDYDD